MGELTTRGEAADLLVRDALLVTPDGVTPGGVTVRDGRIAEIVPPSARPPARKVIDARGRYVLPGLIDSHVHFRTPGLTHKEDWRHGSRAAVAGGVTTVIDMPNTVPPLADPAEVASRAELVRGDSLVDFRFHLGVRPDRLDLLAGADPAAAVSAKAFLAGHHTAPNVIRDPEVLRDVFATAAGAGLRLLLHAEDDGVFQLLDGWRGAPESYRDYEPHRPRSGAIVAVAKVIELVRRYGTAAHIVHVSTAEEADLLAAAAAQGLPVTFEVTPHHLSFTAADVARLGARARLSPAIRSVRDRERLWDAVWQGQAATIGSDHAPHGIDEKLRDPADAPPGLPGVQELLPAVFTGMTARRPDADPGVLLQLIARLCADNPARLFGLSARKGRIAPGLDADLVVFDAEERWTFGPVEPRSKCRWSAYDGWTFVGRPTLTVRRGEVVWDAGRDRFGSPGGVFLPAGRPGDLHRKGGVHDQDSHAHAVPAVRP
ncbi:dihydroorotase family protein [Planotetraspora sp. A-T 1434]|uniref:dihydroorotase n=1 Tax=Planotetraspora sp. A-T 1434 TaxID=2979219 RepID=UPI0021C21356|nr:dihydroorotase family protein [Planotetraspora sp. A-T 1434]MCT9933581.1 dihydroorotase family protein [Planotetraspora sp. A-T 1434]